MKPSTPVTMVDTRLTILNEAGYEVTELTEADIPDYVALVTSAYRGDVSKQGWTTEADLLGGQRLDEDMAKNMIAETDSVILFVRDKQGQAIATVYLRQTKNREVYLGTFAVSPLTQGKGVGSALMNLAEAWVSERWNIYAMRMSVIRQRGELITYYERRGYERTGEVEPFPYDDERFGVPKVDGLEFVLLLKKLPIPEPY